MVLIQTLRRSFARVLPAKPLLNNSFTIRKSHSLKEELINLSSKKINYLRVGQGDKNILCFPGAMGTIWTDFEAQIKGLDRNKFTIMAWDPPGHGKSRPPERNFNKNFYNEDADTLHDLIQELKIKPFSLLGWSDGGISGMIFAAKYPKLVEKLVIWGASSFILPHDGEAYESIRDVNNWSERKRNPMIEVYGKNLQAVHDSYCDAVKEIMKDGGDICSPLLKDIECPTLILHGDKDSLVDSSHPKYLMENIKNTKYYGFPNGKHNIHQRYAEEFNRVVTEFILA